MEAQPVDLTKPIVIDVKKSKKKRKYSKGLKEVQVAGRRFSLRILDPKRHQGLAFAGAS